jgi:hypothetical protein
VGGVGKDGGMVGIGQQLNACRRDFFGDFEGFVEPLGRIGNVEVFLKIVR